MSANPKDVQRPQGSATTCIVGCKLPHGLHLDMYTKPKEKGETPVLIARHTIKGMNDSRIVGGYGLTEGIPTDFMEAWLKENHKHPAVLNGSIFMHTDSRSAQSRAKDGRDIRTGLEPINPTDKTTKDRFKIHMDKDGERAYAKQLAENPVRNRQQVE